MGTDKDIEAALATAVEQVRQNVAEEMRFVLLVHGDTPPKQLPTGEFARLNNLRGGVEALKSIEEKTAQGHDLRETLLGLLAMYHDRAKVEIAEESGDALLVRLKEGLRALGALQVLMNIMQLAHEEVVV